MKKLTKKEKSEIVYNKLDSMFHGRTCELNFSNTFELLIAVILLIVLPVSSMVLKEITVLRFVFVGAFIVLVYNVLFALCFCKTKEFGYLWAIVKRKLPSVEKHF